MAQGTEGIQVLQSMAIGLSCLSILDDDENPLRRTFGSRKCAGEGFCGSGDRGDPGSIVYGYRSILPLHFGLPLTHQRGYCLVSA